MAKTVSLQDIKKAFQDVGGPSVYDVRVLPGKKDTAIVTCAQKGSGTKTMRVSTMHPLRTKTIEKCLAL